MDTNLVGRFGLASYRPSHSGWVRQEPGKPVGFGTFIFAALGSCALAQTAKSVRPKRSLPLLG